MPDRIWDRSLIFTALAVTLITAVSLWLMWSAAPGTISRFSILAFLPALAAALASYALRTFRFYYFLRRNAIAISFPQTFLIQLIGFALAVTPGRLGEIFKLRLLNEKTGTPVARSAPLLLLDRLTEGGGFLSLAFASALLMPSLEEEDIPISRMLLLGLAAMLVFVLTRALWKRVAGFANARLAQSRLGERWATHLQNLWLGLDDSFTARQIAGGLGLSVAARFCDGAVVFFIAQMLGVKLVLPAAVFVLAVGGLVGGASFLPAGIGAVETTMIGLLLLLGVAAPNAIAITLFTRLIILWLWVMIGLAVAFRLRLPRAREKLNATPEP